MTAKEILDEIKPLGRDRYKKVLLNPSAPDYIRKAQIRGTVGKKRRSAKC